MTSEKKTPPKVSMASQAKNFFIGGISGMTATCFVIILLMKLYILLGSTN